MTNVPELEHGCGSWIVVRKSDGTSIAEIWNRETAEKVNQEKYTVLTAMQYLKNLNKRIKDF